MSVAMSLRELYSPKISLFKTFSLSSKIPSQNLSPSVGEIRGGGQNGGDVVEVLSSITWTKGREVA